MDPIKEKLKLDIDLLFQQDNASCDKVDNNLKQLEFF